MKNEKFIQTYTYQLTFEAFSDDLLSIYNEALGKSENLILKADLAISKEFLNQSRSNLLPQVRVTGGTNWNDITKIGSYKMITTPFHMD